MYTEIITTEEIRCKLEFMLADVFMTKAEYIDAAHIGLSLLDIIEALNISEVMVDCERDKSKDWSGYLVCFTHRQTSPEVVMYDVDQAIEEADRISLIDGRDMMVIHHGEVVYRITGGYEEGAIL